MIEAAIILIGVVFVIVGGLIWRIDNELTRMGQRINDILYNSNENFKMIRMVAQDVTNIATEHNKLVDRVTRLENPYTALYDGQGIELFPPSTPVSILNSDDAVEAFDPPTDDYIFYPETYAGPFIDPPSVAPPVKVLEITGHTEPQENLPPMIVEDVNESRGPEGQESDAPTTSGVVRSGGVS